MKPKAIKASVIALGGVGLAIACPALLPALALASKDFFGEVLAGLFSSKDTEDSLGRLSVNAIVGVLTGVAANAFGTVPKALSKDHNYDLELALATACQRAIESVDAQIRQSGDEDLQLEMRRHLKLWQERIERAIEKKDPGSLFLVAAQINAEELILSLAQGESADELIAQQIEDTLRRWLIEQEQYRGIAKPSGYIQPSLIEYLRREMPAEISRHLGEIIKSNEFKKSWIAFQRVHLQDILYTVTRVKGATQALIERVDSLAQAQPMADSLAKELADFLSRSREEEDVKQRLLSEILQRLIGVKDDIIKEIKTQGDRLAQGQAKIQEGQQQTLAEIAKLKAATFAIQNPERGVRLSPEQATPISDQRISELTYLDRLQKEEELNQEEDAKRYTSLEGRAQRRHPQVRPPHKRRNYKAGEWQELTPADDVIVEIRKMKQVALLGEPGCGKTTTMWLLAVNLLEAARNDPKQPVPLLIRLGRWTEAKQPLPHFIASQLGGLGPYLETLLKDKRAALLLDGLNELPVSQRESKYSQVEEFIRHHKEQHKDLLAVVSCRELDYK